MRAPRRLETLLPCLGTRNFISLLKASSQPQRHQDTWSEGISTTDHRVSWVSVRNLVYSFSLSVNTFFTPFFFWRPLRPLDLPKGFSAPAALGAHKHARVTGHQFGLKDLFQLPKQPHCRSRRAVCPSRHGRQMTSSFFGCVPSLSSATTSNPSLSSPVDVPLHQNSHYS